MDLPLFFSTRAHILVCTGPRCRQRGAGEVFRETWTILEEKRVAYYAKGGAVRLTESGCQGACDHGPNAIAYYGAPGGRGLTEAWYAGLATASLVAIAEALHRGDPPPDEGRYDPGRGIVGGT